MDGGARRSSKTKDKGKGTDGRSKSGKTESGSQMPDRATLARSTAAGVCFGSPLGSLSLSRPLRSIRIRDSVKDQTEHSTAVGAGLPSQDTGKDKTQGTVCYDPEPSASRYTRYRKRLDTRSTDLHHEGGKPKKSTFQAIIQRFRTRSSSGVRPLQGGNQHGQSTAQPSVGNREHSVESNSSGASFLNVASPSDNSESTSGNRASTSTCSSTSGDGSGIDSHQRSFPSSLDLDNWRDLKIETPERLISHICTQSGPGRITKRPDCREVCYQEINYSSDRPLQIDQSRPTEQ